MARDPALDREVTIRYCRSRLAAIVITILWRPRMLRLGVVLAAFLGAVVAAISVIAGQEKPTVPDLRHSS
jgi:hypothetical protein